MAPPKKSSAQSSDDLATAIADELTKSGFETYFNGNAESPAAIKDFLSTGSSLLDLAIGNRPNAGIPGGRITEISGLEGSGKSLVCAHIMKSAQAEGGVAVLLDTENAVNEDFYNAIGLDFSKVIYRQPDTVEEIFETIDKIIEVYAKGNKEKQNKKIVIIVDSVTAAPTRKELEEGTAETSGYGTEKAKFLSQAMRKSVLRIGDFKIFLVFTNQLRQKLNAQPFADPWTTPGGKAIDFYTSVRIRLQAANEIKNSNKDVIGIHAIAKVVKNRCGPPKRRAELDIYFDRGIDDFASWVKFLKGAGIIDGSNGRFTYVDSTGAEHKFQTGTWKQFVQDNPTVVQELYNKMAEHVILRYKSDGVSTEDGTAELDPIDEE